MNGRRTAQQQHETHYPPKRLQTQNICQAKKKLPFRATGSRIQGIGLQKLERSGNNKMLAELELCQISDHPTHSLLQKSSKRPIVTTKVCSLCEVLCLTVMT